MIENLEERIGDLFQEKTKYQRKRMKGGFLDRASKPKLYKEYPECEFISLPEPKQRGGEGLWGLIKKRRSFRDFSIYQMPLIHLSQLLWATQGITLRTEMIEFRASPSAGALYPIETYLVVNNVEDIERGIYHYHVLRHGAELLKSGDFSTPIARAGLDQEMLAFASVVFVWTAMVERSKWKYKERAYRYIYLDAGHIGQSLAIASEALGLRSCAVGALFDEEVNRLLNIDREKETVVYMTAVGR